MGALLTADPLQADFASFYARLLDCVGDTPEVEAVYLIGSRARGDHRPESDLDVLVEVAGSASDDLERRLAVRLRYPAADLFFRRGGADGWVRRWAVLYPASCLVTSLARAALDRPTWRIGPWTVTASADCPASALHAGPKPYAELQLWP